jgi:hypothetical protein
MRPEISGDYRERMIQIWMPNRFPLIDFVTVVG